MLRITKDELLAMHPCDPERRLELFGRRKFLTAAQALDAGASVSDICWVAGQMGRKDLLIRFALACAQRVAHHNTDPRVQAALDAAQAWLDCPTTAAAHAAAHAAKSAAESAAWSAITWSAAESAKAAESAAWSAAWSVAWCAAESARSAAAHAAESAAESAAKKSAWSAARSAERQAQVQLAKDIFR